MRIGKIVLISVSLLLLGGDLRAQTPAAFRVLFGVTDVAQTRWDGSIKVIDAGRYSFEPWRFEGNDNVAGELFHFSTHHGLSTDFDTSERPVANGFILRLTAVNDRSEVDFSTAQGAFSFRPSELSYGSGIYKLGGRVYIDRVPVATRLTNTPEEEDFPSAATGVNGDVWLAFVQFHHSPNADELRASPPAVPKDFRPYAEPTGGDQIWARKFAAGNWGEAVAVTSSGRDLYKTAAAVDGGGRAWVFWSENRDGNFDIFTRAVDDSGAHEQIRISNEPGSDIDPVATTDARGRVWVAWQGWRNGAAAIYASHQEGGGFSKAVKVSESSRNEWDPAIAADKTGRVAVAWDSYRNGNYDVYARIGSANGWGGEIPVAATERYEAYPSLAYDPNGRLWVAYEEGGRGWGKDFGAYATSGVSLYRGRLVKLRGIEPNGSFVDLDASLDSALPGPPNQHVDRLGSQMDSMPFDPDPTFPRRRPPDRDRATFDGFANNTSPRLVIAGSARIWLAFRSSHPTWRCSVGSSWWEYLVSFDGRQWTRPIFVSHTDNLLDNRPALLAADGKLLMVNSSDGRGQLRTAPNPAADPYNNDLWSNEINLGPALRPLPVVAAVREPAAVKSSDQAGAAAIQALRNYRGGPQGNLRIVRGEFHRHSEISVDGADDGTMFDQWRYILDAASLDWVGCCDHDNGGGREYSWWITQKLTDVFYVPGVFSPMFSYERSVRYPDGHRNVVFATRGIRPLPRFAPASLGTVEEENQSEHTADTQMLYAYLRQFDGIAASHTSATSMGTDWRDNDPGVEPVVEIYQGIRQSYEMPGAPRSNSEQDAIGGWRPKGFVSLALEKGFKLGFEASSDHMSTHISYSNLYVHDLTREAVLQALKDRHVYASTDDILADVESGTHMMGDEFATPTPPILKVRLRGTSQFAKVSIIRDGKFVYTATPNSQNVEFSWQDNHPNKGHVSYYYVRGEQSDGELVWISPLWITYTGD